MLACVNSSGFGEERKSRFNHGSYRMVKADPNIEIKFRTRNGKKVVLLGEKVCTDDCFSCFSIPFCSFKISSGSHCLALISRCVLKLFSVYVQLFTRLLQGLEIVLVKQRDGSNTYNALSMTVYVNSGGGGVKSGSPRPLAGKYRKKGMCSGYAILGR
jgi:hypothetical protein